MLERDRKGSDSGAQVRGRLRLDPEDCIGSEVPLLSECMMDSTASYRPEPRRNASRAIMASERHLLTELLPVPDIRTASNGEVMGKLQGSGVISSAGGE